MQSLYKYTSWVKIILTGNLSSPLWMRESPNPLLPRFTITNKKPFKIYLQYLDPNTDRAERHDFWPRLWLFYFPFLFPPKIRGKKKRKMNSKNCDQKSFLSARSLIRYLIILIFLVEKISKTIITLKNNSSKHKSLSSKINDRLKFQ